MSTITMKLFTISLAIIVASAQDSFGQNGPGGIGLTSNLAFWLDANASDFNTPVDNWQDLSGNNVVTTVNGNPVYIPSAINGRGVVRFDGDGDEIYSTMSINGFDYDQLTVISVYVPRIDHAGSIWGEDNGGWDRFLTDVTLVDRLNSAVGAGYDPIDIYHPSTNIPTLFVTNVPTLSTVVYDDDLYNGTHVYINGQLARSFTSNAADYYEQYNGNGYSNLYVGAIGSGEFRFTGDIAEVIVFRNDISLTQRIIVENYLSAKYGLSLPATNDLYTGDDLGFDYNVAGIGNLNGSVQNDSRGTGIVRIYNPSDLNNSEFLFWGDDNGILQATNTSDVPTGVQARSNRLWRVSEVNASATPIDAGSVSLSFSLVNLGPIDAGDLRLLVDTDQDGIFADEAPISGAVSLGNNEYVFNNVNTLVNNAQFTIGTANSIQTPLPVALDYFFAEQAEGVVQLAWQTLVEKDAKSFEVSRSKNGKAWFQIAELEAVGAGKYWFHDDFPLAGRSYYKLTAIDFDLSKKSLAVTAINRSLEISTAAFPNPFADAITVRLPVQDSGSISVVNTLGRDCTALLTTTILDNNQIRFDFTQLPDGFYVINIPGQDSVQVIKKSR